MRRALHILDDTRIVTLLVLAAALAGAAAVSLSFAWYDELRIHRVILEQYVADGVVTQHVFPFLYGALAGLAEASVGLDALHLALYFAAIGLALALGRRYGLCGIGLAALGLLVAWHPYMLLGTIRLNDNALNVPLMLGFALALALWKRAGGQARAALFGLAFGALFCSRANAATLALVPLAMLAAPRLFGGTRMRRPELAGALAGFLVAWIGLSALFTDTAFFFPQNGPYNFFVGANPFSAQALIERNNAEYSFVPALAHYGIALPENVHPWVFDPATYRALGLRFILENPLEFLRLAVLKAAVYFGPDLVYADGVLEVAGQWLAAAVHPLWLVLALLGWRASGRFERPEIPLTLALFALPFLLLNADPRFRLPADMLALIDGVARAAVLWRAARRDTTPLTEAAANPEGGPS